MNIRVEDNNLLDYSDWISNITGSTLMFNNVGGAFSKNYIEINNDPFNNNNYVWNSTIQSGATAHSSAGWNTDNIIIEPGVNYRYSQWVKRKNNSVSRVYFGCAAYGPDNKPRYLKVAKTGYIDTGYGGPYYNVNFTSSNWLPNEQWVLINYAILNSGSTTGSTLYDTGIWNSGGTKTTAIFNDLIVTSGTTQIQLRYYGPYVTTTGATHFQASYPRIDILDGTEPSINTLLQNEGMWRSGTTYIKVEDKNLLDYTNWSGLTCGDVIDTNGSYWRQYGTTNCRIIDKDPFNNDNVLWRCATTGATTYGGFNVLTGNFQYIDCDPTQDYRFSCWFNRKSINNTKPGGFYFGMWATSGTTALNVQDKISTNYTNTPYSVNKSTTIVNTNQDEWYLAVGYLYKTGTPTGGTVNSAIYNLSGTKITGYTYQDFINNPLVTDISIKFAPIYDASGCTAYLAYPRIDLIDGTEPSINTLLQNEGMWRSGTTMIYVDDVWKNT